MRVRYGFAAFMLCAWQAAQGSTTELTGVAQLSARGDHACVATTAGGAKCWGNNTYGQLGGGPGGPDDFRIAASDVVGLTTGVLAVAAATGPHTCAIVVGGGVKCWGLNNQGQLGDGTTTNRPAPVDVVGLPWPAAGLTGGISHTCAFSIDGAAACWGANTNGQLGDGTTTQRLAPTIVPGLTGVVEMSAAVEHTCAITAGGGMKCWGANFTGQLGDGTRTGRLSPVDVSGLASGVTAIATGGASSPSFVFSAYSETCAVAAGITKCWGGGSMTGTFYGDVLPVDVAGAPTGLVDITMGGSWYHTLGPSGYSILLPTCVVTSTGAARCWGSNYCGMLGDGLEPNCTMFLSGMAAPGVEVAGLSSGVASVSSTAYPSCALLTNGAVKCWGTPYGSSATPMLAGGSPQSISFYLYPTSASVTVGGTFEIYDVYGGGSGNPVVLSSLTPETCSISGMTVTGVSGGTCTIAANQAGSEYYEAAPQVTASITVDPHIAQNITFISVPTLVAGTLGTLVATVNSGRPITLVVDPYTQAYCALSGNIVEGKSIGTCVIRASVPGDETYAPGQASISLEIGANPGTQSVAIFVNGGGSGSVTSLPAGINCGTTCLHDFPAGSTVTLTATAASGSNFDGWSGPCTGTGPCTVTMDAVKKLSARFDSSLARLTNLSTRALAAHQDEVLIGGFVIGGLEPKTVVIRARSRSTGLPFDRIMQFGPTVRLFSGGTQIAANDDWSSAQSLMQLMAMGLQPPYPEESAIYITLAPGAYTAILEPSGFGSGIGIVEIFEVDRADQPLINLSTRGHVGAGDHVMIAGFIIEGDSPQTVAIVGRGPSLAGYGINLPLLADPELRLVRMSDLATVASNDNWRNGPNASALMASGFAPTNDSEAAMLVTLEPGAYTAIMSGVGETGGIGIVEVFRVSN